jgi:hypothetical protein
VFLLANSFPGFQFIIRKGDSGNAEKTIAGIDWQFNAWGGMFNWTMHVCSAFFHTAYFSYDVFVMTCSFSHKISSQRFQISNC